MDDFLGESVGDLLVGVASRGLIVEGYLLLHVDVVVLVVIDAIVSCRLTELCKIDRLGWKDGQRMALRG